MNTTTVRAFGFGGQGIITFARLIGEAGILDGREVIMTEEYSPYITGGWSRADLIISDEKIDYPMISEMDYLVTLSQEGFDTNRQKLAGGGTIFLEKSLVNSDGAEGCRIAGINAKEIAESLENPKVTNIVMLGFFNRLASLVSRESLVKAVEKRFPRYAELNVNALEMGYREGDSHD